MQTAMKWSRKKLLFIYGSNIWIYLKDISQTDSKLHTAVKGYIIHAKLFTENSL